MCGIAGALGLIAPPSAEEDQRWQAALRLLRHRGPDQAAVARFDRAVLINTRLSVMDLRSVADLPFRLPDRGVTIAYNGEVSNFRELADHFSLESRFGLKTRSDSEVIAHLYALEGVEFVKRLTGMFSLAIVDEREQKAFLVRDFYGITPLFYAVERGTILFSSEMKVLRHWLRGNVSLNKQAIFDFLTLGYIPGAQTPYREIVELDKGHLLEVDLQSGRHELKRYYQLKYAEDTGLTEDIAAPEVFRLVEDSVRRNLDSEAPVGTTLSGGVDTSAILAIVHRLGKAKNFHTFSVKIGDSSFDESRFQRLMSERTGTTHHEIPVGHAEIADNLVRHVAYLDEPSANGATIPSFVMSKVAAGYVKVLLSGEGGDEIFNAYDTHQAFLVRRAYRRLPAPLRTLVRGTAHRLPVDRRKLSFDFKAKRFTEGAELSAASAHIFWRHGFKERAIRELMGEGGFRSTYDFFEEEFAATGFEHEFDRMSYMDMSQYLYGDLMVKNDRMMMAHSVESRFPYLDRPLVEYMARVPRSLRINRFRPRYLQKRAMREVLPAEILGRKSFGLEIAHSRWLLGPLGFLVDEYLSERALADSGVFDPRVVRGLWDEHRAGQIDHGRGLWSLIVFQVWHKLFLQSDGYLDQLGLSDLRGGG